MRLFRRRRFLVCSGALLAAPQFSFGQPQAGRTYRIGLLQTASASSVAPFLEALLAGLRDLGYIEGKNLVVSALYADGKQERLPELVAELVRLKVDVIVTSAAPAIEAARRGAGGVAIVFAATGDPVGAGLVDSLARPGGNITGLTLRSSEIAPKWLQLVRELSPTASRVALLALANANGIPASGSRLLIEELRSLAQKLNMKVVVTLVKDAADVPVAFATMQRERAQALIVQLNPISRENRAQIVELGTKQRLVAIYEGNEFAEAGGLISYGPNLRQMFRRSATYVDKILKGAKPGELPVEQPSVFELIVNLKSATALGVRIPQSILLQATKVID